MTNHLDRRDALKVSALSVAGAMLAGQRDTRAAQPAVVAPKRALRIAHLTDMHVEPERESAKWLATCLHHVQSQADKPDLILFGGDTVFDSMEADDARAKTQWDLWHSTLKAECSLQHEYCIGNHDVWGINKPKSKTTGDEPLWGKKRAMDQMKLDKLYRSFDRSGWHFVVLDSVMPHNNGYLAKLGDEQLAWLQADLAAVAPTTPVLVLSHIPILAPCVMAWTNADEKANTLPISGGLMHMDGRKIMDLFLKHKNVKVCLSGHLHLVDRAEYDGVTYFCDGAVSGNWWKGDHKGCKPGYAVLDLNADGTFSREYVAYGWAGKV